MKKSKQIILIIVLLVAVVAAAAFLFSRLNNSADTGEFESETDEELTMDQEIDEEIEDLAIDEEGNDFENPLYDNEADGAEVNETAADEESFYGSWVANSNHARYLYGNINLTIDKNGKWTGNITDEDFSGTWTYNGSYITLESELINADLFYAEDGALMYRDHSFPEDLVVLSEDE